MDQTAGYNKITSGTSSTPVRTQRTVDRSIEEIRQNIEQTRGEITDTVDQLGERLKETVDWRSYVSDHPIVAVSGAALIGFYLTRKLLTPKRSTTEELLQTLIKTGRDALVPKKQGMLLSVLAFAGKYALEQFQKHQEEQQQQQQQDEQMQAIQAYQQLMAQQLTQQTSANPVERHRTASNDY